MKDIKHIFSTYQGQDALIWQDQTWSYQDLLDRIQHWEKAEEIKDIQPGDVVALKADFSPNALSLFFVLAQRACILVPLTSSTREQNEAFIQTAQVETILVLDDNDQLQLRKTHQNAAHVFFQRLQDLRHAGLILFSSGSTGESKAVTHDLTKLMEQRADKPGKQLRTMSFLLYDHIGGLNTMLYTLLNGGCLITVPKRQPEIVLQFVERFQVELLPVSPTFLNLVLISQVDEQYDLSSLQMITYGTEPMPQATLKALASRLPHVAIRQTYGLSEVGILSSQSKARDSLWMRLGGEGYQTRVIDGKLEIKADTAMLGYLNAPSPFTEDGWFQTGDAVETDGEFVKVLGRVSELINVGGEKVYPQEVENVILQCPNVAEAVVYAEKNILTGAIVCARVCPRQPEDEAALKVRLTAFCRERLDRYKVPLKIEIMTSPLHNERFKKQRVSVS